MRRAALTLLLLASCRGEEVTVLSLADAGPPEPISSCDEAFAFGRRGDACAGLPVEGCLRERGCCVDEAYCESGALYVFEDNCEACGLCEMDRQCPPGEWCVGGNCLPCEPLEEPPVCAPPRVPLERNGCPIQECAVPSQCAEDEECGEPGVLQCVQGRVCACPDPSCCVNVCAPVACAAVEPPPEGCSRPCEVEPACPTGFCVLLGCVCEGDEWRCNEVCTEDFGPEC